MPENIMSLDINKIIKDNERVFLEANYLFQRYSVDFCLAVFYILEPVDDGKIDLEPYIRFSDKQIYVDKNVNVIVFGHTNLDSAIQAVYAMEKRLFYHYGVSMGDFFLYSVVEKDKKLEPVEMFSKAIREIINARSIKKIKID